jgi:hypothetical protein
MKQLKTSKTTAQGNSWVPYVQGSDGVVISPKKLDSVTVISRGEKLMKTLIMEEKYSKEIKIGTLF